METTTHTNDDVPFKINNFYEIEKVEEQSVVQQGYLIAVGENKNWQQRKSPTFAFFFFFFLLHICAVTVCYRLLNFKLPPKLLDFSLGSELNEKRMNDVRFFNPLFYYHSRVPRRSCFNFRLFYFPQSRL